MTLIEHGATVDLPAPGKEHRGQTALHIAAGRGPLGLVSTLIGCGADPSRGTADGTLPVEGVSSWYTRDTELARRTCTHRAHALCTCTAPVHAHAHIRTCTCTCTCTCMHVTCMHVRGACVQVRGLLLETLWQRALCAGWLIKLGTERKNWRKRFAVLLAEPTLQLRYYSDAQLSDCRGKLCLTHTSSRISSPAFAPAPTPWPPTLPVPPLLSQHPAAHQDLTVDSPVLSTSHLPPPSSLLPTPYSLLPAPCHHPQHDPSVHAGKLDLRGLRAPPQSPSHYPGVPTRFSFDVRTPEQSFVLCAHTEVELQVWLRQLASLVHHRADGASLTYGGLSAAVAETSASSRRTTDLNRTSSSRDSSIGPGAPALHLPTAASSRPPRFHGAGAPSTAADQGSRLSEGGGREEEAEDDEGFTITLGSRHAPLTMQVTSAFVYSSLQLLRPRLAGGAEAAGAGAEATAAEEAGAEGEAASGGDGAALQGALLCQGRFERGQRVLVVRSPVEIANETASSLELAMAPQLDGGTARAPELLPAHQARALPLALTEGGAEPAAWGVCLRPADWRTSGFGWGTLVPIDADTAILACVPDGAGGGGGGGGGGGKVEGGGAQARWLACAAISTPELEQGASDAMAHERKSVRRSREKRCNELKGFGLPVAETLLKAWPCARRGGRLFAPGWLYLTQARAWRVHGVCTAPRLTRAEHALHATLAPRVHHACTALAPWDA